MIEIEQLREVTEENVLELNELMRQLRKDHTVETSQASLAQLQEMVADKNTILIVAKDGQRIVGMALLVIILKIGKSIGSVEDVVVHEEYRGQGLGEKIMKEVIAVAKARKLLTLGLTSRPIRVAGNKLYQKLGFTIKETNVYRLKL
jgi:ribosomal protein S18 acetylase RimI-like enzyme